MTFTQLLAEPEGNPQRQLLSVLTLDGEDSKHIIMIAGIF